MSRRDEFFKEIGRITVNFAYLDFCIGLSIIQLMKVDNDVGLMVTTEQSFRQKLALLSSLTKHWDKLPAKPAHITSGALATIVAKCSAFEVQRNLITHSLWSLDGEPEDQKLVRVKTTSKQKKGLDFRFEEPDITELTRHADELREVADDLMLRIFTPSNMELAPKE